MVARCDGRKALAYKSGETPKIGDRVKSMSGRTGTVIEIQQGLDRLVDDTLSVKWDDGHVSISDYPVNEQTLVSRAKPIDSRYRRAGS